MRNSHWLEVSKWGPWQIGIRSNAIQHFHGWFININPYWPVSWGLHRDTYRGHYRPIQSLKAATERDLGVGVYNLNSAWSLASVNKET